MPALAVLWRSSQKRGELKKKMWNISIEKKNKKRRGSVAPLMTNRLRCQKQAKGHCRSQEEEWPCCRGGPEGQGLLRVSAVQDSVELCAKRSQLNLKSVFPSTGAFSGTDGER